ncbi:MAG: hypothetical protein Fur0010_02590 [Bdellovibrio sp.]
MKFIFLALFISQNLWAKNISSEEVETLKWSGVDVVWIKDDRFPTYFMNVYFADGALGDGNVKGSTAMTMSMLTSGTRRYDQKSIADILDFFAVSLDSNVNHEYTRFEVSGLIKDIVPTMKKICHLFQDSSYPPKEIKKQIKQHHALLSNIESDHRALADMIFREVSMKGSQFAYPVIGKMRDHIKFKSDVLRLRLKELNEKVKKRIYITGPREVLKIEKIITEECGWNGKADFVRAVTPEKHNFASNGPQIFLVPVKKANQSQVRIGRILEKNEVDPSDERHGLLGEVLAGGFTSILMDELRTKRGLVYGVGAFSAGQRDYGRALISTQTRNEKVVELINVVKESLDKLSKGDLAPQKFDLIKRGRAGSYPFRFEEIEHYLFQLMMMDHLGLSYDELYKTPEKIQSYSLQDIASLTSNVFDWSKQTILVLGEKSLLSELQKLGKVTVLNYKDFL